MRLFNHLIGMFHVIQGLLINCIVLGCSMIFEYYMGMFHDVIRLLNYSIGVFHDINGLFNYFVLMFDKVVGYFSYLYLLS